MKQNLLLFVTFFLFAHPLSAQKKQLYSGDSIENRLLKDDTHIYELNLKKGQFAECVFNLKSIFIAVDIFDNKGKKISTFIDSPYQGDSIVRAFIQTSHSGKYELHVYPLVDIPGLPDSLLTLWKEENQGSYILNNVRIISMQQRQQEIRREKNNDEQFVNWIIKNAQNIKGIDANNEFEDLQPLKNILSDVRIVGLGESSHGTSEFFRMKHRLLEFLVKEMEYSSLYIEASMARCRYINDYVLYGKGSLDTATAIQGFYVWRVEEMKDMIEWIRNYNLSVPEEKRVSFYGFDLQINDLGWKELISFYKKVNKIKIPVLDSLKLSFDSASNLVNTLDIGKQEKGRAYFKKIENEVKDLLFDMVLNAGEYTYLTGNTLYQKNLMNLKLIIQEIDSYKHSTNEIRDFYMAQNILHLLNEEGNNAKVVVWAHNFHISKGNGTMGKYLSNTLKNKYYAFGFDFLSGSFQTKNQDLQPISSSPDIMSVENAPENSLPWYLSKSEKENFYLDFRHTGTTKIINFNNNYPMHSFGSTNSVQWPIVYPAFLTDYDGMIFIRKSTASKNFSGVELPKNL